MRTSHYYRFARQVQEQTATLVLRYFRPADHSTHCTAWVLVSSLILAAANRVSLTAVAALRLGSPSRETLRQALLATLPDYVELRRQLAGLLRSSLPRSLRRVQRRRYPMAIDLHDVAYFKRRRTPPAHVRKGKRRPGTTYGHLYASASLLRKGQYFVVALTPYDPDEDLANLVRRLLRQAAANGFSPRYVLMDRTFWSVEVFRYLQRAGYPFLMPVLARGKKPTAPGGPTGTRVFLHGCPTGCYSYRLVSHRRRLSATVTIVVHRRNCGGQRGKHGRYAWAYAMWRMDLSTITWVRQSYRRRFRIESSYRLLEAARGRTSSRDEGWRLWYVVLAVILLNCWLDLRRAACRYTRGRKELSWWNRLLLALAFILLWEPPIAHAMDPQLRQ
jgi:putative transposase